LKAGARYGLSHVRKYIEAKAPELFSVLKTAYLRSRGTDA